VGVELDNVRTSPPPYSSVSSAVCCIISLLCWRTGWLYSLFLHGRTAIVMRSRGMLTCVAQAFLLPPFRSVATPCQLRWHCMDKLYLLGKQFFFFLPMRTALNQVTIAFTFFRFTNYQPFYHIRMCLLAFCMCV
jgi:hypothetical protein